MYTQHAVTRLVFDFVDFPSSLLLPPPYLVLKLNMEMLSLNISSYSKPSEYQVSKLPSPSLIDSKDVIVKVYAASINPIDVKRADGALKLAVKDPYV